VRISVIGAGGWGTAFARLLALNEHEVILWVRDPVRAAEIDRLRENRRYLPGVVLPQEGLRITDSLPKATSSDIIALAVPSFAMSDLLSEVKVLVVEAEKIFVLSLIHISEPTRPY